MTRQSYSQRQQILMRKLISAHTKPIYSALQSQMKAAADEIRLNGVKPVLLSPLNTEIQSVIMDLYSDAASRGKKNYVSVKRFGAPTDFVNRVLNYLKQYILSKAVEPISNTTKDIINRTIQQAIEQGWGVEKTAKYLETTDITKNRARMIVRTESVRATNLAQWMAAGDEVYQMEKSWIAIEDRRTRISHSHAGVDGETQDLDKPFTNGLMYPGDPDGEAEDVVNCRCTMGYKVKRTLDGKPLKKQIQAV